MCHSPLFRTIVQLFDDKSTTTIVMESFVMNAPASRVGLLCGIAITAWITFSSVALCQRIERKWYMGVEAHPTTRGYYVRSVQPGSPAYKANVYRGDYIESVNGILVGYLPGQEYYPLVSAFNESKGDAHLKIGFASSNKQWRTFETTVHLVERSTTVDPETRQLELRLPANVTDTHDTPSGTNIKIATVDMEKSPTEGRDGDSTDNAESGFAKQMNRDDRGVVDYNYNPVVESELGSDRPTEQDDRKERE